MLELAARKLAAKIGEGARVEVGQAALVEKHLVDLDQHVEEPAGEGLGEVVDLAADVAKVFSEWLNMRTCFSSLSSAKRSSSFMTQEVAARAPEQEVEPGVEMQEAEQRDEVGDRLVIGEESASGGLASGRTP